MKKIYRKVEGILQCAPTYSPPKTVPLALPHVLYHSSLYLFVPLFIHQSLTFFFAMFPRRPLDTCISTLQCVGPQQEFRSAHFTVNLLGVLTDDSFPFCLTKRACWPLGVAISWDSKLLVTIYIILNDSLCCVK